VTRWVKRHRGIAAAMAGFGLIAIVVGIVWFQPHKLFIDERVDEALPVVTTTQGPSPAASAPSTIAPPVTTTAPVGVSSTAGVPTTTTPATTTTTTTTTTMPAGPVVIHTSELIEVGHAGTGSVLIVELEDGSRVVRFEDLDESNGPDLVVILSTSDLIAERDAYHLGGFVDIGELKGNQGNQNYVIPDDVDLTEYTTVAIWCRRFNYTFNAATTS